MRGHSQEQDFDAGFLPKGRRIERNDHDLLGRAAAAGRTDVLGSAGILGLQRAVGNAGVGTLVEEDHSPVHDVANSGGGASLDTDTRADMESRFGQDFGDVRVHADSTAQDSARSVNPHAYTVGSNIVFQRDRYDPSSGTGKHMLAHELTHAVQQRSEAADGTAVRGGVKVSDPSDRFEREAEANADRLMSSTAPVAASPTGPHIQRCGDNANSEEAVQRCGCTAQGEEIQRENTGDAPEDEKEASAQTFAQRVEGE